MLIDGGPDPDRLMAVLDARLPPWDRRIDLVVLSHPHEDHASGLALLLARYRVGAVAENGMRGPGPGDAAFRAELARSGLRDTILAAGDHLSLDGASMDVLWPRRGEVPCRCAGRGQGHQRHLHRVRPALRLAAHDPDRRHRAGDRPAGPRDRVRATRRPAGRRAQGRPPRQQDSHDRCLARGSSATGRARQRRTRQPVRPSGTDHHRPSSRPRRARAANRPRRQPPGEHRWHRPSGRHERRPASRSRHQDRPRPSHRAAPPWRRQRPAAPLVGRRSGLVERPQAQPLLRHPGDGHDSRGQRSQPRAPPPTPAPWPPRRVAAAPADPSLPGLLRSRAA